MIMLSTHLCDVFDVKKYGKLILFLFIPYGHFDTVDVTCVRWRYITMKMQNGLDAFLTAKDKYTSNTHIFCVGKFTLRLARAVTES